MNDSPILNDIKITSHFLVLYKGGGYAEYVAIPEDLLLPVPAEMSLTTAAGIPEVWLTAYQLLHFAGTSLLHLQLASPASLMSETLYVWCNEVRF